MRDWIFASEPGEWAVIAPTFADGKRCIEQKRSGLIDVCGGIGAGVKNWNRSEGILYLANGSEVYIDGADDGALRIQGRNLRGAWCDEVGLWRDWQRAWNETLQPAVRFDPGRIIATGTPKMGHPLIGHLLASESTVNSVMRTTDNEANLSPAALAALLEELGGTTLGRQELDGEYIAALEGEILPRYAWRYFLADLPVTAEDVRVLERDKLHGPFDMIVHSWDTTWKAKATSDFVSGQVWGCKDSDRYLLALFHEQASLDATVTAMLELHAWSTKLFGSRVPQHVIIETAAWGVDAADQIARTVQGVHKIRADGDKVRRALAASPALETGHCYVPGRQDPDPTGPGYGPMTPPRVQAFIEECSLFQGDMKHAHDDQVDAWSQMVNWTRRRGRPQRARISRARGRMPRPGTLSGV